MKKYVLKFFTKAPLTPTNYDSFHRHFTRFPKGLRLDSSTMLLETDEDIDKVKEEITEHLESEDEFMIFTMTEARWKMREDRDRAFRVFLGGESDG